MSASFFLPTANPGAPVAPAGERSAPGASPKAPSADRRAERDFEALLHADGATDPEGATSTDGKTAPGVGGRGQGGADRDRRTREQGMPALSALDLSAALVVPPQAAPSPLAPPGFTAPSPPQGDSNAAPRARLAADTQAFTWGAANSPRVPVAMSAPAPRDVVPADFAAPDPTALPGTPAWAGGPADRRFADGPRPSLVGAAPPAGQPPAPGAPVVPTASSSATPSVTAPSAAAPSPVAAPMIAAPAPGPLAVTAAAVPPGVEASGVEPSVAVAATSSDPLRAAGGTAAASPHRAQRPAPSSAYVAPAVREGRTPAVSSDASRGATLAGDGTAGSDGRPGSSGGDAQGRSAAAGTDARAPRTGAQAPGSGPGGAGADAQRSPSGPDASGRADPRALSANQQGGNARAKGAPPVGDPASSSATAPAGASGASAIAATIHADGATADRAKAMTPVSHASPVSDASPVVSAAAGERLRDALVSVANHAVLRGAATGQIDVPELGRVVVHAHAVGGAVDVAVSADQADTRVALRAHVGAMTQDLRQADVPVARVSVERGGLGADVGGSSSQGTSSSSGERGTHTQDRSREPSGSASRDDDGPARSGGGAPGRVRIVL